MEKIFNKEEYSLPEKAKKYFKVEYIIFIIIAVAIVISVGVFQYFVLESEVNYMLYLAVIAVIIIAGAVLATTLAKLDYENYSYTFDDQGIKVVQGIFFKTKEFLPYNTIQDVTLEKGPILSRFKLANVEIKGINSRVSIIAIEEELAEKIKESILYERSKYNVEY